MVAVSSNPCYCMRAPVTTITRERLVTLAAEVQYNETQYNETPKPYYSA